MKYLPGDIFLVDSDSTEAKIVKFLMQSPTFWHWIIGKFLKIIKGSCPKWLIDDVKYYHAGLIWDECFTIEQQKYVEHLSANRLKNKPHIILRKKYIDKVQTDTLLYFAKKDYHKEYDILLIIGKTLSWLTGIGLFTLFINSKEKEICVTRIAKWYFMALDEKFGRFSWHFVTTDDIEDWCKSHPKEWEVIEEIL